MDMENTHGQMAHFMRGTSMRTSKHMQSLFRFFRTRVIDYQHHLFLSYTDLMVREHLLMSAHKFGMVTSHIKQLLDLSLN